MKELSIFVDESGSDSLADRYYLVTLVLHEQDDSLGQDIDLYERSLRDKGLPDIPFHMTPLLYRKKGYADMDEAMRKRLLSSFRVFFRHLPIRYKCLVFRTSELTSVTDAEGAMRRGLVELVFDNLAYFQGFDDVKIYYDNGQHAVAQALRKAIGYALAKNAVIFRLASPVDYRLSQAADYICTVELAALRFQHREMTATDGKFYGTWKDFRRGVLKEVRAKRI